MLSLVPVTVFKTESASQNCHQSTNVSHKPPGWSNGSLEVWQRVKTPEKWCELNTAFLLGPGQFFRGELLNFGGYLIFQSHCHVSIFLHVFPSQRTNSPDYSFPSHHPDTFLFARVLVDTSKPCLLNPPHSAFKTKASPEGSHKWRCAGWNRTTW